MKHNISIHLALFALAIMSFACAEDSHLVGDRIIPISSSSDLQSESGREVDGIKGCTLTYQTDGILLVRASGEMLNYDNSECADAMAFSHGKVRRFHVMNTIANPSENERLFRDLSAIDLHFPVSSACFRATGDFLVSIRKTGTKWQVFGCIPVLRPDDQVPESTMDTALSRDELSTSLSRYYKEFENECPHFKERGRYSASMDEDLRSICRE